MASPDWRTGLVKAWNLVAEAKALMRSRGLEPTYVHEIAESDGFRLAFGYLTESGGGLRSKYLEVALTAAEYAAPSDEVVSRVLRQLGEQIDNLGVDA